MKARGSRILKITSILEIIIGVVSLAMTFWILSSKGDTHLMIGVDIGKAALWTLVLIYGIAAFQILAGIVGFVLSNKPEKYKVCYFFGMGLILIEMYSYINLDYTMANILIRLACTIVPAYYLYGALKNKENA